MNLTISGHHLEVTPSLRSYVMAKLERILRHFDQVVDVKVLLTVHNQKEKEKRQRAGCTLRVRARISLSKPLTSTFMPPSTRWLTSWTASWCATRPASRAAATARPSGSMMLD